MDVRLGIDSSGPHLALALWAPHHGTLAERAPRVERRHAERIVPELEALFAAAGLERDAVTAVLAGVGPGSYTGVRVGVAAARGFAAGRHLPLGGADSLAAIAWAGLSEGETGLAVMDARRGNVYAASYRREGGTLHCLHAPTKLAREDARRAHPEARWLEDVAPSAVWIAMQRTDDRPAVPVYL